MPLGSFTWEGALQESPESSLMRAAAVGLLELMRTGGLISMEWRFWDAWEDLLAMVREVKECRFLVFFLVSECFGAMLLWAAAEVPSPASTPGTGGLSHSISCLAAELNWNQISTRRLDNSHGLTGIYFSACFYLKFNIATKICICEYIYIFIHVRYLFSQIWDFSVVSMPQTDLNQEWIMPMKDWCG